MSSPLRHAILSPSRLRWVLLTFLVALLVPLAALIWHAYGQLKWEAFHQYRGSAETLTRQVDVGLVQMIETAEARSFLDYEFANAASGAAPGVFERSPLAAFPVRNDVAGTIGYFQVGPGGEFSTPLLPRESAAESVSVNESELDQRTEVATLLQQILSDNRLVEPRPGDQVGADDLAAELVAGAGAKSEADYASVSHRLRQDEDEGTASRASFRDADTGRLDTQLAFDRLNEAPATASSEAYLADSEADSVLEERAVSNRVSDLNLDSAYEQKSAQLEAKKQEQTLSTGPARTRGKRKELTTISEQRPESAGSGAPAPATIKTFESEIDPYEFSMLDSGHFVLFRRVWREGERYIQGLVLDQGAFISEAIAGPFQTTALPELGSLLVAYQGEVLDTLREQRDRDYFSSTRGLSGNLLYRARLSSPFDGLELIFSLDRLPPGPGAPVLVWVSLVLLGVLGVGFFVLYRTGLAQLELNRKQQDFVSAVSHELKTPITSIRMYAEMLREGWADEEKKQSYYTYIQDESERLSRLVNNVLQLARLTRNEAPLSLKPMRAGKLLDMVQSKTQSHCDAAGFTMVVNCSPENAEAALLADEDSFLQIMINLLDNAFKFSDKAELKQVDVACQRKNKQVSFSVRDYGPGIPTDQLKAIFQLFYRTESELTRETVGTGIGLAIVHQLTQAMGGTVDVINQTPGVLFRVTFPLAQDERSG